MVLDYNMVIPNMLLHYFPSGMLGLGLTALLASFMSGMAGNVTAFNTVWTYDIFKAYIRRDATDADSTLGRPTGHVLWCRAFRWQLPISWPRSTTSWMSCN